MSVSPQALLRCIRSGCAWFFTHHRRSSITTRTRCPLSASLPQSHCSSPLDVFGPCKALWTTARAVHTRTTHLPYGPRLREDGDGPPHPEEWTCTSLWTCHCSPCPSRSIWPDEDNLNTPGDNLNGLHSSCWRRTSELCWYRPPPTLAADFDGNEMPREVQGLEQMFRGRRFLSPYSDIVLSWRRSSFCSIVPKERNTWPEMPSPFRWPFE